MSTMVVYTLLDYLMEQNNSISLLGGGTPTSLPITRESIQNSKSSCSFKLSVILSLILNLNWDTVLDVGWSAVQGTVNSLIFHCL